MALSAAQKVTVAEITYETYATIDAITITAEQETAVIADIATWNLNRNDLDVELTGAKNDVKYRARLLLDEIRIRVRNIFGLPLISARDPRYQSLQLVELEVGSNFG